MFEKLKQLKQLKDLQSAMKEEKVEMENRGAKIVMNGNFMVEEIHLSQDLQKEEQEKVLQDLLNDATKKIQMSVVQKFSGMM